MKYTLPVVFVLAIGCVLAVFAAEPTATPAITVAIMPFHQALAKDAHAPLAEAIGEMMMVRLSEVNGLVLVDRTTLDKVLKEQELSRAMSPADQTRLGKIIGAQFVLTGSVTAVGDEFQIDAHLLDVETARIARSARAKVRGDQLTESVDRLASELVGELKLKLPELTAKQIDGSPEANLHFMRGLGHYFAKSPDDAIVEFMKVLAIDPSHARARFWNGMAYVDLGEYNHAKLEFGRFLKEFGRHELTPRAKELLKQCETQSSKAGQGESP
jgi:TolB-like protein